MMGTDRDQERNEIFSINEEKKLRNHHWRFAFVVMNNLSDSDPLANTINHSPSFIVSFFSRG